LSISGTLEIPRRTLRSIRKKGPTSMDGDGTQAGFDIPFTKVISEGVKVPVVASGGAGKLEDFYDAVVKAGATILLAASVFHFRILTIRAVKEFLRARGLEVKL
jgi:cyclase